MTSIQYSQNGIVEIGAKLKCYFNGQEPFDIKWYTVDAEGKEISLVTDKVWDF